MFNNKENIIRKYNECILCLESNSNRNIITLQYINYNKRTFVHRLHTQRLFLLMLSWRVRRRQSKVVQTISSS